MADLGAKEKPLKGLNVAELHAIGPVPFAGMLLQQLGASVTRIGPPTVLDFHEAAIFHHNNDNRWFTETSFKHPRTVIDFH